MPIINNIKYIYSSPDFTGESLVKPLKLYHGFFVGHIESCQDCQKVAWIIAHIATGIFAYTVLGAVAAVGMVIKAIVIYAQYSKALDILKISGPLGSALDAGTTRITEEDLSLSYVMEYAKLFPHWVEENREALDHIETLNFNQFNLTSLPEVICTLKNLRELDVGQNSLTYLPDSIENLTNLRDLKIEYNTFTYLPKTFGALKNLQKLHVGTFDMTDFPEEIYQLENLQELVLHSTAFTSLPEAIGELKNLQVLEIYYNKLISLPESIGNLTNLRALRAPGNRITYFPDSLGQLTNLQELNLKYNRLFALPEIIFQLTDLRKLCLDGNCLGNRLTSTLDSFSRLSHLQELDLSCNDLYSLSESICQLTNLQKLNLSFNNLSLLPQSLLPQSILQLTNLRELNLSNNYFRDLPDFFAYLPATCELNVEHNFLSAETLQAFQTLVAQVRQLDPTRGPRLRFSIYERNQPQSKSLETALTFWLNEYQRLFPRLCTDQQQDLQTYETLLNHPEKVQLHRFLDKLKTVEDFREEQPRKALIYRVCQMLELATINASFREGCFANFVEALGTCGDRATIFLNQIEILWHCSQKEKLPEDELIKLLVGVKRIAMLRTIAAERVTKLGLGDAIEIHLFYQIKLKDELELPVSTQGMLYEGMAKGITPKMLAEDKAKVLQATSTPEQKAAILVVEDTWKKRIQKIHSKEFEEINNTSVEEIANISMELQEQQRLEQTKLLSAKRDQLTQEKTYKLTLDYLKGTQENSQLQ